MAVKARLKFRHDLHYELEHRLVHKYGFVIFSRLKDRFLVLEKQQRTWQPEVLVNGALPEDVQNELIGRCNKVMEQFLDPDAYAHTIKIRLNNIAATLPPQQRRFIHEWISRNIEKDE